MIFKQTEEKDTTTVDRHRHTTEPKVANKFEKTSGQIDNNENENNKLNQYNNTNKEQFVSNSTHDSTTTTRTKTAPDVVHINCPEKNRIETEKRKLDANNRKHRLDTESPNSTPTPVLESSTSTSTLQFRPPPSSSSQSSNQTPKEKPQRTNKSIIDAIREETKKKAMTVESAIEDYEYTNTVKEANYYNNNRRRLETLIDHLNYNYNIKLQSTSAARIVYKSPYILPFTFVLIALTLLPIQYHAENFAIQMKKMLDSCADSAGYFNENQTHILDTLFPYGFGGGNVGGATIDGDVKPGFEQLAQELAVIDEIFRRQMNDNNLTIKYLTQADCLSKNFTSILNLITIAASSSPPPRRRLFQTTTSENQYEVSRQQVMFHQLPKSNVILVCDDDSYKKSLLNSMKQAKINDYYNELEGNFVDENGRQHDIDLLDFQTNVLTQWNISCKNLSTSTMTISYAQMTFLSGEIIGAIFFAMLADYIGRKKVYLLTLYTSTIVGAFISMVQTYKQFIIFRFPIAALAQGCFIVSYVLIFELILKSKNRNIYCSLFVSTQYGFNLLIANAARLIADWRYMQLAGSLVSSFAIGYPWLITESFKWLCVKEEYAKADRVCRRMFKENAVLTRLMKLRGAAASVACVNEPPPIMNHDTSSSSSSSDSANAYYWPMVIWQPTFRKIICYFVLMWSVLSLTYFFINEEDVRLTPSHINNYVVHNFMLAFSNTMLGVIYYKMGKRFPLGSCMLLGGAFYLASSLISQDLNAQWLKLTFHLISKILVNCSINILMFFVCELFPCEIRCSSFSFFLSIKHLSEMFAIYIFKVNLLPMSVIRIGLAIFCMLLCTFAFLLPERSAFSFNLDYLDYLNSRGRYFQCHFNNNNNNNNNSGNNNQKSNEEDEVDEEENEYEPSTMNKNNLSCPPYPIDYLNGTAPVCLLNETISTSTHRPVARRSSYYNHNETAATGTRFFTSLSNFPSPTTVVSAATVVPPNLIVLDSSAANRLELLDEECQTKMLTNNLIKKINCENHCKTGKLNPLYEEDNHNHNLNQLISTISNGPSYNLNYTQVEFASPINRNNSTVVYFNESSTKF